MYPPRPYTWNILSSQVSNLTKTFINMLGF